MKEKICLYLAENIIVTMGTHDGDYMEIPDICMVSNAVLLKAVILEVILSLDAAC